MGFHNIPFKLQTTARERHIVSERGVHATRVSVRYYNIPRWILTLPQSLTLLLTQRTMGMPRGVLLGTVESCVEKLAE